MWEKKNLGKSTWKTLTINNELPDINKPCKKQIRKGAQETTRTQGNSERNSPNRACMEIHHEFRAARKEPEALQQLNKKLWEMNMGLEEIKKAPGDINTEKALLQRCLPILHPFHGPGSWTARCGASTHRCSPQVEQIA